MPFSVPSLSELRSAAESVGLHLDDTELEAYRGLMDGFLASHDAVDAMQPEPYRHPAARGPVRRPSADENPLGAWVVRCTVGGDRPGPLAGRTLALKDNICLADVPMSGGAGFLDGFVPDMDATVVHRILDAGGRIEGKAACEYLSASGGSHTSASGPVQNPLRAGHTTGGSSSGCGALVAAGEVDMAIGGDQGGSIRIPAAFCGIVGLKPTFGLVPYTGILSIEATLDHTGPMTRTVADNALLLEVIAGPDGLDPRQLGCRVERYTDALSQDVSGLRIGVLAEGFGQATAEASVEACVRAGAEALAGLGAELREVSVPEHLSADPVGMPLFLCGGLDLMTGDGIATHSGGLVPEGLPAAFSRWRERPEELTELVKLMLLTAASMPRTERRRLYVRAQSLRRSLRAAYDHALGEVDLLLMPTSGMTPRPLPAPDAPREERILRSMEMVGNTGQFDVTGHPAISVPCGAIDGLPVGLMLVGRHFEEATLYRAAHAFEGCGDWRQR